MQHIPESAAYVDTLGAIALVVFWGGCVLAVVAALAWAVRFIF